MLFPAAPKAGMDSPCSLPLSRSKPFSRLKQAAFKSMSQKYSKSKTVFSNMVATSLQVFTFKLKLNEIKNSVVWFH